MKTNRYNAQSHNKLSIMIFPQRTYPFDHSFLTEVYGKLFVRKGHTIIWVMEDTDSFHKIKSFYWNGSKVYLLGKFRNNKTLFGRILNKVFLIFKIFLLIQIARKEKVNIIQVRNSPYYGLYGMLAKLVYRTVFVFQRSIMVEEMKIEICRLTADEKKWRISYLRFQNWLVNICMRFSDLVLPISDTMKDELATKCIRTDNMLTMPLGINPDDYFIPKSKENLNFCKGPLLLYFGAVQRIRNLDFLLYSFKNVLDILPNTRLLILGVTNEDRNEVIRLKSLASSLRIDKKIIWHKVVPREKVNMYIAISDVCVSTIPPIYAYLFASPTKLVESMGMAKPVVANDLPEQKKLITSSGGGLCVPYNTDAFAKAMIFLLKNPKKAKIMGEKGKSYVYKYRSYLNMAERLEKRYYSLLKF